MAFRLEVHTTTAKGPDEAHHDAGSYDELPAAILAAKDALEGEFDGDDEVVEVRLIRSAS